ncbi:MAG: glycosyltransferase 87 family protein [Dehalococcoidia bacterium]
MLPQTRSPAPGASASRSRSAGVPRFTLLLMVLLVLGVAVRLPFLPRLGHAYDQNAYRAWMGAIQDYGLAEVFERTNTDYVGYHYILWGLAQVYSGRASEVGVHDKELRVMLKLPGLIGDLLTGALVAVVARAVAQGQIARLGGRWRALGVRLCVTPPEAIGLAAAALFLFNPAVLYASAYWGQQDSLVTFFMLLACWLSWRRLPGWAGAALALGTIVKPQPLVLVPLLAWIVWQRTSWSGLLRGSLAGVAVLIAGHAYFLLTGSGERMWQIYTFQLAQNEHLSFGAYNLWWPFERLADARPKTAIVSAGGASLTYGLLATALTVAVLGLAWLIVRRGGATAMLAGVGVWLAGYYLVGAGAHERYALPALAFLLAALPLAPRLRWPLLLYSAALLANLLIALPLDRRWHQGDPLWLTTVVSVAAVVSVVGLGWVAAYLTPRPPSLARKGEYTLTDG